MEPHRRQSRLMVEKLRTLKLHAYPVGDGLDALGPESLVELRVKADVGGAHRLLSELDDGLDGPGRTLLEGAAVDTLVKVDGVFAGHDILEGGARLASLDNGCAHLWAGTVVEQDRAGAYGEDRALISTTATASVPFWSWVQGPKSEVSIECEGGKNNEEDVPCLEDVGVDELEDGDSLTDEQRLSLPCLPKRAPK